VPYEFNLDRGWSQLHSDDPDFEYEIENQSGLCKLLVIEIADEIPEQDLELLPAALREQIENGLKAGIKNASVKLIGSRTVSLHGVAWLEVTLEENLATGLRLVVRCLIHSGPHGSVFVCASMPEYDRYQKMLDDVIATLRIVTTERH